MVYATARPMQQSEVPVIDIGALRDGRDPDGVGAKLAWAASEVHSSRGRSEGIGSPGRGGATPKARRSFHP